MLPALLRVMAKDVRARHQLPGTDSTPPVAEVLAQDPGDEGDDVAGDWRRVLTGAPASQGPAPAPGPPPTVFDVDYDHFKVVGRDDGQVRWTAFLPGYIGLDRPPCLVHDANRVYVALCRSCLTDRQDGVICLDARTGRALWHTAGPFNGLCLSGDLLLATDRGLVTAREGQGRGRGLSGRGPRTRVRAAGRRGGRRPHRRPGVVVPERGPDCLPLGQGGPPAAPLRQGPGGRRPPG